MLLLTIGLCVALKNEGVTVDVANHLLFSPRTMLLLSENGHDSLVDLIHEASEIEDVVSLVPHKLPSVLDSLKEEALSRLAEIGTYDFREQPWLERLLGES